MYIKKILTGIEQALMLLLLTSFSLELWDHLKILLIRWQLFQLLWLNNSKLPPKSFKMDILLTAWLNNSNPKLCVWVLREMDIANNGSLRLKREDCMSTNNLLKFSRKSEEKATFLLKLVLAIQHKSMLSARLWRKTTSM